MSNDDDLQPIIDQLRANRPEATALELDAIKQRVRARASHPARRRTRRAQLMKSRVVILTMLVFGMLLSTAGAGLAVTGLADNPSASSAQYPSTPTPSADSRPSGGGVLGEQDEGPAEHHVSPPYRSGGGGGGTSPAE